MVPMGPSVVTYKMQSVARTRRTKLVEVKKEKSRIN